MYKALDRFCVGMASLLKVIGLVLLWIEVGVIALQVASRYLLNDSLPWTEEASRLVLVWLAFIGAAACSFLGAHLRLDLLEGILHSPRALTVIRILVAAATLLVLGALLNGNTELIEIREGISFTSIPLSSKWLAYAVTFGAALMIVGTLADLARVLLSPSRPAQEG